MCSSRSVSSPTLALLFGLSVFLLPEELLMQWSGLSAGQFWGKAVVDLFGTHFLGTVFALNYKSK